MAKEEQKPKAVGIWIRVSTEDQARGDSPEHHEQRARYYAQAKGWTVREVYHLEAVSGKAVIALPEAKRMLQDIASGNITGLIFSKLARLARNTRELLEFSDIFRERGADLISLQESIDTSTPAGRLFYTMIAAMAQWEREEIADRVAASVPVRARLGKPLGGAAPFGYRWENRSLVPDPIEAPIRRLMFELFLEHKRKKTVARILNDTGHRTRNGKFSDTTVDRLLRDPVAKGQRRANYTKSLGEKKHWVTKPEDQWVYTSVEGIVTEEIWVQCNAILDTQREGRQPIARKAVHLFTGLTHCICGQKMYVLSKSDKYVCQKCRNKIPTEDLESVFEEQLRGFFLSSKELSGYLSQADDTLRQKEEQLRSLEHENKKVKAQADQTYKLYLDGNLSSEGFGIRNRPLETRQKEIGDQIAILSGEIDFLKIQYQSSDQIIADARDLCSRWSEFTEPEKRTLVETITERIVIGKDEVEIDLSYVPPSLKIATKEQRNLIRALPFCKATVRASKPPIKAYPTQIQSLGDQIRKRRLDLCLLQKDVAKILGVTESSIWNWESNRTNPALPAFPAIIEFLGFNPIPKAMTIGDEILAWRTVRGLPQSQSAKLVGVDPSTLARWESGVRHPTGELLDRVRQTLDKLGGGG